MWHNFQPSWLLFVYIVGTALILAFFQEMLTGGVLFPRSYIYVLPLFAMIIAYGIYTFFQFLPKTPYFAIIFCVIGGCYLALHYQYLSNSTNVDDLNAVIEAHRMDDDIFVIACCNDYPIYYLQYILSNRIPENPNRLIAIPLDGTLEKLFEENVISNNRDCSEDMWDGYKIYICDTN